MKKILFPVSNRTHLARQQLLLKEIEAWAEVIIPEISMKSEGDMAERAMTIAYEFEKYTRDKVYDLALIRGDRFELLGITTSLAYRGIPIAHIEGFDLSGEIDNRVRYAISHLSNFHFVTNQESLERAENMKFEKVFNYGSLDVEYAQSIEAPRIIKEDYILVLYHNVQGEDEKVVREACEEFKNDYKIIYVKGNSDYKKSEYAEEYNPQDFISILKYTSCLVGNSSAGIKEASILGTPVVNVGGRQKNRLMPNNVLSVPCEKGIADAVRFQIKHGKYEALDLYYQSDTSKKISEKIKQILSV